MIIRPVSAADAPAVAALSQQLGYPVSAAAVAERLISIFQEPAHGCFVAKSDGAVVGQVTVARFAEAD